MEQSLYRYILKYSWRQQIILTALAVASFGPYYLYLDMPKAIVNQGISGKGVTFPVDLWGMGVFQLDQIQYLLVLCFGFIGLVFVQQCFKYAINVFQGISGERMLRRLRYQLYTHVLRFPLPTFRKMSQGEIIPMITAEVETLGGFIAESFALPIFQGGMLLVIGGFLFYQNWMMGVAAISLYPIQLWLIPKLQRRVNQLGKERVRGARRLADRIGETISGMQEVHANDASNPMLAEFTRRLGVIYWVRYKIYQQKFVIKFINNSLQQFGPFLFYSIGGVLAIRGELDVGTIVAAVAAQKEMGGPLKELLTHYQMREDSRIKYEQVISQFAPDGLRDDRYILADPDTPLEVKGELEARGVTYSDEHGVAMVDNVAFAIPLPAKVAVVGSTGREELLMLMSGLLAVTRGRISIGGADLAQQTQAALGRRFAYVGASSYLFNTTLADNLVLGLRHRPLTEREMDAIEKRRFERELGEARASGNMPVDPDADWTDYAAAGVSTAEELRAAAIRALRLARLDDDVYQLGLRGTIDPAKSPDLAARVLAARTALRAKLADPAMAALVETWDRAKYNSNATVAENVLFGTAVGDVFHPDRMAEHPYVLDVLAKVGLRDRFLAIGHELASTMVELFADLPADHEFFQQFSFISADDLPELKDILARAPADKLDTLDDAARRRLMSLPFKIIPARHRLGVIGGDVIDLLLHARAAFAEGLPEKLRGAVAFFDPDAYTRGANLLDNIVFGKIGYGQAQAAEKVGVLIAEVVDELQLRDTVTGVGLSFEVGIGGTRLSAVQRQKAALARSVLKRPDILFLSEATALFDAATERQILDALMIEFADRTIIWSLQRPALAEKFEHILVVEDGKLVEHGPWSKLSAANGRLADILQNG